MNNVIPGIRGVTGNLNDIVIFRNLLSTIDHYNTLAKSKGLPIKRKPIYNRHMNDVLMKRLISNIIDDIDRIKNVKGNNNGEGNNDKTLTDVTFEGDTFTDDIWTYTLQSDNIISVTLNADEFSKQFTGDSAILDYEHMPYERLIDTEGNEYPITSYNDVFSFIPYRVKSLTIQDWTNTNVTNMSRMFNGCDSFTSLTLGNKFDTSSVTDMSYMFSGCSSLQSLTLDDNFNTSSVTNMLGMFGNCSKIISLTLGDKFDTSNVTDMSYMFTDCLVLQSLTLSDNFNTSNVTTMDYMFNNCDSFTSLTLYRSAELIITQLPTATWNVNGSPDNTITTQQGLSAGWNPSTLPGQWGDDQWTLSRTI